MVPLEENPDYYPWMSQNKIINPIKVITSDRMEILKTEVISFGVALCNEIMDVSQLVKSDIFSNVDIILNPSNVPQLYKNNFESRLDIYAEWIHSISGKPILRFSSGNYVNWINEQESFKVSGKSAEIFAFKFTFQSGDQ